MSTVIRTNSKNYSERIKNYLKNKRLCFTTSSLTNGTYTLTIYDLLSSQTDSLIQKMTKHFHLSLYQQEFLAPAA